MCGRYAMGIRLAFVRHQLQQQGQQVDEVADDDDVRETYNFAPGNYGAVYRADTPDYGGIAPQDEAADTEQAEHHDGQPETQDAVKQQTHYKIQAMKWGLIPFWTKRSPDYGSMLKTINCRDDSLAEDKGMWTSMKRKKRCVVICQGFYEWLKKGPSGKEKIPHYIRRKDGNLMCFAGLWDCVKYEGSDEKLYTYTVITTSSNPYLRFLHDRMPVILDPGSPAMATWLDPTRVSWSKELQSILKPYEGELECYPVSKEVGKVGNNSPDFIVPINSKDNKKNIANFFASATKAKPAQKTLDTDTTKTTKLEPEVDTVSHGSSAKRKHASPENTKEEVHDKSSKAAKVENLQASSKRNIHHSTTKTGTANKKMRSSTSNGSTKTDPKRTSHGTQRITNFFK
ncbi:hypothetical protein FQN50_005057 [Emmonsiellopsis sp. PD_5]|nr:hypothetical protein FQN50_005057 [Emmonsiellopsis sp. PD_5]